LPTSFSFFFFLVKKKDTVKQEFILKQYFSGVNGTLKEISKKFFQLLNKRKKHDIIPNV